MDKLVLEFASPFWDTSADWINYISNTPGEWVQALNLYKYTGKPWLMMFNVGSNAENHGSQTDLEVAESGLAALKIMYPAATNYVSYTRSNWGEE